MNRQSNVGLCRRFGNTEDVPEYDLRMDNVSLELGLKLWELLTDGNTEAVREMSESRQSGPNEKQQAAIKGRG